jgi:hypothetical protein
VLLCNFVDEPYVPIEAAREVDILARVAVEEPMLWEVLNKLREDGRIEVGCHCSRICSREWQ